VISVHLTRIRSSQAKPPEILEIECFLKFENRRKEKEEKEEKEEKKRILTKG